MLQPTLRLILFLIVCLCVYACANQVAPSGGDKDEEPPKMTEAEPANYSTNFKGKKITLTFDEYVKIEDAFNQVIISPPVEEMPEFRLKGKSLVIEFKDTLRSPTTYTINFGEAIKDITEGNIAQNFQYVFATGPQLDSLAVKGVVMNAEDNKPAEGVWVILYKELNDSVPFNNRPYYFARTLADGSYHLTNLRAGTYKLFALKDEDFNYQYNLPNEAIAYRDEPIVVGDSGGYYPLRLFQEDQVKQQLLEVDTSEYELIKIVYARGIKSLLTKELRGSIETSVLDMNDSQDTLRFWYLGHKEDVVSVAFIREENTDTISINAPILTPDSLLNVLPSLTVNASPRTGGSVGALDLKKPINILFNRPMDSINVSKVVLLEDTLKQKVTPKAELVIDQLNIDYSWKQGMAYELLLLPGCVYDHYGLTHDTLRFQYLSRKVEDYGTLAVSIDNLMRENQYIILLKAENGTVIRKDVIAGPDVFKSKYTYLLPGKYSLRVVEDKNENGKWDTGNYLQKIQPEQVYDSEELIQIRANWDMEFKMSISN